MFSYTKKILSCLLVAVMLLASISVSFSVFAKDVNVNLELNGGTLNGVTSDYAGGSYLPESGEIVREGLDFVGWYDNAEFIGSPVSVVPNNLAEDVTYYARWVKLDVNFDDFESYNTINDVTTKWTDWSWPEEDVDFVLNKNSLHTLSGKNSLKFTVKKANANINLMNQKADYSKNGDGVAFWIETTSDAKVSVKFNGSGGPVSKEVAVLAGKQIVTIPWSDIPGALDKAYLWQTNIIVDIENYDAEVYVDDIGTYSDIVDYNVKLNANGGVWADGYNVPNKCYANMSLPTMDNIKRENLEFAGWYDNAELTGLPVGFVPADISTNKEYWAKWVAIDPSFDNFDSYSDIDAMSAKWTNWTSPVENATIALNTDASNAFSGNNSLKFTVNKAKVTVNMMTQKGNYSKNGDGVALWIESTNGATVKIRFNSKTTLELQPVTVPAGKHLVTLPWSDNQDVINTAYLWQTNIIVTVPNAGDVVYIDDMGTYSDVADYNVTFNTNGAKWAEGYSAPQKVYANMALPTEKNLENEDAVFAGWYDNADFTGSPVASVAADISGDKEYWAKWIAIDPAFDNFDSYSATEELTAKWTNWTYPETSATIALNTDANHALSGNNSFEITYNKANATASVFKDLDMSKSGNGIAFWVESTNGATVKIRLNNNKEIESQSVTVPAGKQMVTILWNDIPGTADMTYAWRTHFMVSAPKANDVVYIDDIGTYSDYTACNVTFNTNGGSWVDGFTAPTKLEVNMPLPTMDNIKRENLEFAGWYDNAEFTGSAVTTVADVSSDRKYWAKWVDIDADFDNFDSYSTTDDMMTKWENWSTSTATVTLNTDANYALSGNNSFKITFNKANANASLLKQTLNFDKLGDGIAFWLESTSDAKVSVKFNGSTGPVSEEVAVSAGKQFVTIPWDAIPGTADMTYFWRTTIIVSASKVGDVIHIDDIGTYSDVADYNLTLNTNSIKWAEGYTAPVKAYANMVLPTKANFDNKGFEFVGWYDNADYAGSPVVSVPADISGDKEYWAKWITIDANFDNFDSYSDTDALSSKWTNWTSPIENATVELNTDANNASSGNNSLKFTANKAKVTVNMMTQKGNYSKNGDGVALWIESTSGATVKIRFNSKATLELQPVTVSAGKYLVTLPWSDNQDVINTAYLWQTNIIVTVPNAGDVVYIDDIGTYGDLDSNKTMPNREDGFTYSYDENARVVWNFKGSLGSDSIVGFATDYVLERYNNYVVAFDYKYLTNENLECSLEPQAAGGELDEETIKNETDESKQTLNGKDANSNWATKKVVYKASDVTRENKYFGFYGKVKADTEYDISIKNIGLYSLGDVDFSGDINANDLASLKKELLGADDGSVEFADVNNDGRADITDLVRLKKMLVK